jgi:molecular chaperone GrpE
MMNSDEKKNEATTENANSFSEDSTNAAPKGGHTEELAAIKAEANENHEKYLRALADFDNYKKRAIKERSELIKYQGENLAADLLEVVDNFERALAAEASDAASIKAGVSMIHKQLLEVLSKHGVRGESSIGKPFDPYFHQAISQAPAADFPDGTVCSELKKAYFLKDKLLRVGQVVVSASNPDNSAKPQD